MSENNKKRRINEVSEDFDQNSFLDLLDEYPFLYRSLQAVHWMKSHPFKIQTGQTNVEYSKQVYDYFIYVLNRFFSGCGLETEEEEISDTRIGSFIKTPLRESEFDFNFCLLCTYLTNMFEYECFQNNIHWSSLKCTGEGNLIYLCVELIDPSDDDYDKDYDMFPHYNSLLIREQIEADENYNTL